MKQVELNARIKQLVELYNCPVAVYDSSGQLIQSEGKPEKDWPEAEEVMKFIEGEKTAVELNHFLALKPEEVDENSLIVLLPISSAPRDRELKMLELWLHDVLLVEENAKEQVAFLKNVLLENELPGDVPLKARTLKIDLYRPRRAILLRMVGADQADITKLLKSFFPNSFENYFIPMDEHNQLIIFDCENLGTGFERGSSGSEKYQKALDRLLHSLITYLEVGLLIRGEDEYLVATLIDEGNAVIHGLVDKLKLLGESFFRQLLAN